MIAGLSWPRYITFFITSMAAMLGGSQFVHNIYRPLDDLEDLVAEELARRKKAEEKV
ncbi:protein brawnin [Leptopilina boulardi]|uniref:protein brawnin n=1 Tax=Leptopilina boulardi TaxID=63433 RepID=UPI0021F648C0|nr:protein brawnin [Leptopilina boulardi]